MRFCMHLQYMVITHQQEHENIIMHKFGEEGRTWVDFLLYICYIPLFLEIHDTINANPLDDTRNK